LRLFLFGVLHGQALSLSRRLTPELCHARDRAPAKYDHLKRETGPDKRKSGVGPVFQSSVSGFVARMERSEIRGGRFAGPSLPDCASLHPGYEIN
jgi:hypothetical protein